MDKFSWSCLFHSHSGTLPSWFFGWGRPRCLEVNEHGFTSPTWGGHLRDRHWALRGQKVNLQVSWEHSSLQQGIGALMDAWENLSPIGRHILNSTCHGQTCHKPCNWSILGSQKEQQELNGTSKPRLNLKALWLTLHFSSCWNYWQPCTGWLEVAGWSFSGRRKRSYISSCLPVLCLAGY